MFSRYEGDSENGYALVRLLKLCSNLDPRFMNMTEQSKEDLVVKAVAVGAFMCGVKKGINTLSTMLKDCMVYCSFTGGCTIFMLAYTCVSAQMLFILAF